MTRQKTDQDNPANDPPNRKNDQGAHDGSAHSPEEFDVMNPAKPGDHKQENQ